MFYEYAAVGLVSIGEIVPVKRPHAHARHHIRILPTKSKHGTKDYPHIQVLE